MRLMSAAFVVLVAAASVLLLHVPPTHASLKAKTKLVVLTNNHTNYLSVRCFSFDDTFNVSHLAPWGQSKFRVTKRVIYPSSTMFNCSTNMGTFMAFKYDYECMSDEFEICDWRFDEEGAYRWEPKSNIWAGVDYSPNYESLSRGGVIKGYFAN